MEQEQTGTESEQTTKTSGFAIASLVLGILGVPYYFIFPSSRIFNPPTDIILFILPYIITIILGIISFRRIYNSDYLKGMTCSVIGIVLARTMLIVGIGSVAFAAMLYPR